MAASGQEVMFARRLSPALRLTFWVALSLLVIVLDSRLDSLGWLRSGLASALYPVQVATRAPLQWLETMGGFFVRHGELLAENRRMAVELRDARAKLLLQTQLAQENAHLRALLSLRRSSPHKLVAVRVIAESNDPFSQRVEIDKGARDGFKAGWPVVDEHGLVGQITRVYPLSSEVSLITDRAEVVPVQDLRSGLRLLLYGTGAGVELRYLSQGVDVKPGDRLATSGLDGVYPAGVPVAWVRRVTTYTSTPYLGIDCVSFAGVDSGRTFFVVVPGETKP